MLDTFGRDATYNAFATTLFRKLKSPSGQNDQSIFGFMIICNEDEEKDIDFTIDDYNYILSNMEDLSYFQERHTFDWDRFLAKLENDN